MKRNSSGFTLIEVMIVVAIVGILGAIALPAYGNYLMRGRLVEAFSGLTSAQTSAEEYWSNAHTYAGFDTDTPSRMPVATTNFTFAYSNASASGYLITATGRNQAVNFAFTIDQAGKRVTTAVPAGWTANNSCWIDRKGGVCAQ